MDKLFGRHQKSQIKPHTVVSQYIIVKHSWRGSYSRVLVIHADGRLDTLDPSSGFKLTNSYSFAEDPDIDGVAVGSGPEEFVLSCRPDKKTRKFSPLKLACQWRASLLTDLYQCVSTLAACNKSPLAFKLLGTPEQVPAAKWSHNKGRWVPVLLRVTGYCLECRDATKDSVIWRMDYATLGTPALSLLSSGAPGAPGSLPPGIISSSSGGGGVFSVDARPTFRRPKVLACGARGALVAGMQKAAAQRLGLSLLVDTSQQHCTGAEVLNARQQAEQQLASSVHEMATGEWEVQRLRPCHQTGAALFLLAAPHLGARPAMPVPSFLTPSSPKAQVARRLAVSKGSLIERHAHNYQAVIRRPLTALASLARFEEDPKLLGVEWTDGAPPSLYLSPARDEVLAALLDAAQNALGRPVAVLPGLKNRGDGLIMGRGSEVEVQRWAQEELASRAKEVYPTLVHSSRMLFTVHGSHEAPASPPPKPQPIPGLRSPDGSGAATPLDGSLHSGALAAAQGSPTLPGLGDPKSSESQWTAAPHSPASSAVSFTGDMEGKTLLASPPGHATPQDSPAVVEAVSLLMDTVYDYCACVPPSGVPLFTRMDGQVAASLVALLPMELQQGIPPPVCMPTDEVKQTIMVLQCLQRLSSAPECMDTVLALPNIASRLWAVYTCGNEAVAAEVAKLLLRWWSPHTSRRGTVPWKASPPGPPGTDINSEPSAEELSLSKTAKALCFSQKVLPERCKQLLAPLKRAAPNTAAGAEGLADARFSGMASTGASVPGAAGDVDGAASSVPCSPLLSMAVVEAAAAIAVVPCSATTSPRLLQEVLAEAAALGRPLFALFHHPAGRVADGASLLMREIAYSGASAAAPMRHAALREGAFLFHLLRAVDDADARAAALHASELAALQPHALLPNSASSGPAGFGGWMSDGIGAGAEAGVGASAAAALSRELVASWADQYAPALALLKRVLPPGLIRCLNIPQASAAATPPAAPPPQPTTAQTGVAANGGTANIASHGAHPQAALPQLLAAQPGQGDAGSGYAGSGAGIGVGSPPLLPGAAMPQPAGLQQAGGSSAAPISNAAGLQQGGCFPGAPMLGNNVQPHNTSQVMGGSAANGAVSGSGPHAGIRQAPTSSFMQGAEHAGVAGVANTAQSSMGNSSTGQFHLPAHTALSGGGPLLTGSAPQVSTGQAPTSTSTHSGMGHGSGEGGAESKPSAAGSAKLSGAGLRGNWGALWHALAMDHYHAGLIWNEATRAELRGALAREEAALRSRRQQLLHQTVEGRPLVLLSAWNFSEFEVVYPSLQQHLCVGGIYVRLLLDGADPAAVSKLPQPRELFNSLHHHLLASDSHLLAATTQPVMQHAQGMQQPSFQASAAALATSAEGQGSSSHATEEMQILCIRAMAAVYHAHAGAVGPCEGLDHLLRILDHTTRRPVRHQLLLLMAAVLQPRSVQQSPQAQRVARANGYAVHNAGGTELLVDMAAAAHECTEPSTALGGANLATTLKSHAPYSVGFAAQAQAFASGGALGAAADGGFASGLASAGESGLGGLEGSGNKGMAGGMGASSPQLLTAKPHAETQEGSVHEWYCYLPPHLVGDAPVAVQASTDSPATNAVSRSGASTADSGAGSGGADAHAGTPQPTPPPCPLPPPGLAAIGPLSKPNLARLFLAGAVRLHTPCWADGQGGAGGALPIPLASIRELRWFLSSGTPVLTTHDASSTALHLLHTLATLLPATEVDENGVETVVEPLPKTLCTLASPRCLPRLSQILLTFDPELVPSVASLLELVLKHNEERLSRLYSTGAFYFVLAYPGSNLVEVTRLLQLTHLRQAPRLNLGAAYSSASLAHRSYLGHVLPESLIYCLDTYGPEVFASVLRGNNDTPELLWTHAMRFGRLLPQLSQHLGNLRRRLAHNWGGIVFDYTPVPPLAYPELQEELWCHRYYLRNLCNEARFPGWHIRDHVQLLQSLLTEWRAELARQPLAMSETDACAVLGLKPGPDGQVAEDELRRAYRAMARANHPDKNPLPQARAAFLAGQAAYERLVSGAAGGQGPQVWRLLLLLRAQVLLFRRYPEVLAPYKYPGFTLLMEVLHQKLSSHRWSASDQVQLTQAGTELAWLVCRSSVLNAEELARSDGLKVLGRLVQRWLDTPAARTLLSAGLGHKDNAQGLDGGVQLMPFGSSPHKAPTLALTAGDGSSAKGKWAEGNGVVDQRPGQEGNATSRASTDSGLNSAREDVNGAGSDADAAANAVVATHAVRACAGLAAVASGAAQLLAWPGLLLDLLQIAAMPQAHGAAEAALLTIANLAAHPGAQQRLMELGALTYLVPLLFRYDPVLSPTALSSFKLPFGVARHLDSTGSPTATPGAATQPSTPQSSHSSQLGHLDVLDTSPLGREGGEQEAHSYRGLLAAQALGRLAGLLPAPHQTPRHAPTAAALDALLTPPLASRLAVPEDLPRLLGVLNGSGIEMARVIWSPSMRTELLAGLAAMRDALEHGTPSTQPSLPTPRQQDKPTMEQPHAKGVVASAEDTQGVLVAGGDGGVVQDGPALSATTVQGGNAGRAGLGGGQRHPSVGAPADSSSGGSASANGVAGGGADALGEARRSAVVRAPQKWRGFSALQGELVVGGVYVRVYNSKPAALPADAPGFCKALVRFLYDEFIVAPSKESQHHQQQQQQQRQESKSTLSPPPPPSFLLSPKLTSSCCSVMRALSGLMEAEPRLLGLLASRSAVAPLLTPLRASATITASAMTAAATAHRASDQQHPHHTTPTAPNSSFPSMTELQRSIPSGPDTNNSDSARSNERDSQSSDVFQAALAAAPLVEASFSVLRRLVSHAGCVTALTSTPTAVHATALLLYAPPSAEALLAALRLLKALAGLHAVGSVAVDYGGAVFLTDALLDLALCLRPASPNYQQQQQQQNRSQQLSGVSLSDCWLDGLPHGWRLWGWRQHAPPQSHSPSHTKSQPDSQLISSSAQGKVPGSSVHGDRSSGAGSGVGMAAGSEGHRQAGGWVLKGREDASSDGMLSQLVGEVAQEAAALMALLLGSPSHGTAVALLLQCILPPGLVATLSSSNPANALAALAPLPPPPPSSALTISSPWGPSSGSQAFLGSETPSPAAAAPGAVSLSGGIETPELIWDRAMAEHAAACVARLASACFRHQQQQQQQQQQGGAGGLTVWMPPTGPLVQYAQLEGEVMVGGVYCRHFLKDPSYPLRDPRTFANSLIEVVLEEVQAQTSHRMQQNGHQQQQQQQQPNLHHRLLLLCSCLAALLQQHALLGDHLTATGYVPKLVAALAAHLPDSAAHASGDPSKEHQLQAACAILRVLHTLSSRTVAAQALSQTTTPQGFVPHRPPTPLPSNPPAAPYPQPMAASAGMGMPPQQITMHTPMGGGPLGGAPAAGLSTAPAVPPSMQTMAGGGIEQWGAASGGAVPGALPALPTTAHTPMATPAPTQQLPAAPTAPAAASPIAPGQVPGAAPAAPSVNPGAVAVFQVMLKECWKIVVACASSEGAGPSSSPLQSLAGEGCVLVLELLKRTLVHGNRSRDLVVCQALQGGLLPFLLSMLDWRGSPATLSAQQQQQQDVTMVVRVQVVDVINLLAEPGMFSRQVGLALDSSSVWAAYRGQRHDLFLPASAAPSGSVAGLLTHSQQPLQQLQYFP